MEDKWQNRGEEWGMWEIEKERGIRQRKFIEHCATTSEVEGLAPLPLQAQSQCYESHNLQHEASAHTETLMNSLYSSLLKQQSIKILKY